MSVVHKFPVPSFDAVTHELDPNGVVVHVGPDPSGQPCVWIHLDPREASVRRKFMIAGTGHPIPDGASVHGSFIDGPFVWHVVELGR